MPHDPDASGYPSLFCPAIGRLFCSSAPSKSDPPVLDVALAIYHGGKVDGLAGMEAVAHIIQNRTGDALFGLDPRSVVAAGSDQFVDIKKALPQPRSHMEKRLFDLARRMASQLVWPPRRLSFPDPTAGALYYDRSKPATSHSVNRPGASSATQGQASNGVSAEASTPSTAASMSRGVGSESASSLASSELSEGESPGPGNRFTPPLASSQPVQPSRGRRPLVFLRDRQSNAAQASPPVTPPRRSGLSSSSAGTYETATPPFNPPRESRGLARQASSAGLSNRMPSAAASSGVGGSPQPPTPPLPSPTSHFAPLPTPPLGTSISATARLPPTRAMLPRGGATGPTMSASRRTPVDVDGYHDMVLPCGLFQDEVIDIMYRDLSPEDFEMLGKLDERLPKKNIAQKNIIHKLPRCLGRDCGEKECRVCLSEFEPSSTVVKLPCRHPFHEACIMKWLTQCKNQCPCCNTPIQLQAAPAASAASSGIAAGRSTLRTV